MQDQPTPPEIIAAVARFLKEVVAPEAGPATSFQARVAANALEIVRRQLEQAPVGEAEELERLKAILGHDGALSELNAELSKRIADGTLDLATPGVADHLWATTLAKVAVDQPNYSGYRAALAERGQD